MAGGRFFAAYGLNLDRIRRVARLKAASDALDAWTDDEDERNRLWVLFAGGAFAMASSSACSRSSRVNTIGNLARSGVAQQHA